jgi:RHS repeat-associated protein
VGNETYQYDPYGQLIRQPRSAALRTNAWRYPSGYYDVSTGLYKFGIRYYDATTGRWTQRDPVGGSLAETTKVNPYVYAGDDPVMQTDPSGRGTWGDCIWAGVDTIGIGIVILGGVAATLAVAIATDGILAWVVGAGALYAVVQVVRTTVSEYQACWS